MLDQIQDAKVPTDRYMIPGGYIKEVAVTGEDGDVRTKKLLFNWVTLREMKGKEEDILADDKMSFVERMHRIVARCIVSLESRDENGGLIHRIDDKVETARSIDSMLMSDMLVLIVRLRQLSLGDRFAFKVRCPSSRCKTQNSKAFDLTKIEPVVMSGDPFQRIRIYKSRNGSEIAWQMISGKEERKMDEIVNSAKKDKATAALLARVKTINGEPATHEQVQDLSMYDRMKLRSEFDAEGGIDTSVSVTCNGCGMTFDMDLPIAGESFFSLSETSED